MAQTSFTIFGSSDEAFGTSVTIPSALIADGPVIVPLYAVTQMTLQESYHLPPIGSTGHKAIVATHDDSVTLTGMLVGKSRFLNKIALETIAESSKRGSFMQAATGGKISGLILVTALTIRTDMHVKSLSFTVTSQRRESIDVSVTLDHMPKPSLLGKILDASTLVVGLRDFVGS
ncbi:hypothetical protein [Microvirga pakistanensis]|uniref:hypothetical protein n=1 Tax=Microvirga pakistanensis TaxID=1682650 RepID=UPI00106D9EA5|nr:hypothetical protein [Microvirga pakistanensis]